MKPFEGVDGKVANKRFNFLRSATTDDSTGDGPLKREALKFLDFYADYKGDIFASMQAALDTETPYAVDLKLRLVTAILEGKVP